LKKTPEEILALFKGDEETAVFAIKYYLEMIGNAIYTIAISHLPLKKVILTGNFIISLHQKI
jgi:hypothetical protein